MVTKTAVATGINFFQAQQLRDQGLKVNLDKLKSYNEENATTLKNA